MPSDVSTRKFVGACVHSIGGKVLLPPYAVVKYSIGCSCPSGAQRRIFVKSLMAVGEFAEFVEGAGEFWLGKDNVAGAGEEKE